MKKFSLLFSIFFTLLYTKAHETVNRCALDEINTHTLLNNPGLADAYRLEINNGINNITAYDTTIANTDTIYTIKVVVHVVYLNNNKYENIPDNIIQSQIDALNRDFNALNADTANLRDFFIPFRGNAKIKFELAKTAPNGAVTTGITRTQGSLGNLAGWDPISTILWTALGIEPLKEDYFLLTNSKGKSPWPSGKYLNLYVCDLNKGSRKCASCLTLCDTCGALGGFAYPPSNATNWGPLALDRGKNDGIVIDFRFFGQDNWYAIDSTTQRFKDFYTDGRTTVHEVGHYLGLQHSWGNVLPGITPDGCAVDDFIDDTPEEAAAFASNLVRGTLNPCDTSINTCTKNYLGRDWPDMFENFMDYSTDKCYNLFTKQQVNLMRYNLITRRNGIISTRELAPSLPTAIKNVSTKEFGVSIFPNPASNQLHILATIPAKEPIFIRVYDMTGKEILSDKIQNGAQEKTFSIQSIPAGIYLIQCYNESFSTFEKLVKE